ncbi:MAG: glycoside hydrolase, partial [Epulopiscium sp. Nele67-Bin001]
MRRVLLGFCLAGLFTIPTYGQEQQRIFSDALGLAGIVNSKSVNVRTHPNLNAGIVAKVNKDDIRVLGKSDSWYQISYKDEIGWIYQDYVEVAYADLIPIVATSPQDIVSYGLTFLGTPYVWGGTSLSNGVDCSGFTQQIYDTFDIELSRVSYNQANDGLTIEKDELQMGDLVFFDTGNNGTISHVGIYINDDNFIHSDMTNGVTISDLNSSYYSENYVK